MEVISDTLKLTLHFTVTVYKGYISVLQISKSLKRLSTSIEIDWLQYIYIATKIKFQ